MTMIQPGQTIGIIGGGQLGRMMALSAKEAGFRIAVLDPAEDSPCGQVADIKIIAAYDDEEALGQLADASDVITYEFENIDYEGLKRLAEHAYVPQGAELIRITQDRIAEKAAIRKAGAPVAPYIEATGFAELKSRVGEIGFPCVVKTARGGYDGKGQVIVKEEAALAEAEGLFEHSACVAEAFVPFEKEISVIIQRGTDGGSECLPVQENVHQNHILHETIVPARIGGDTEQAALEAARQIADHLQLIGTLAVEMFVLEDGRVLINELAPRPHNSGHYSIEACTISQFGQHVRAICGWPLRKPELLRPAVMVNVLGQHVDPLLKAVPNQPGWSVHLYGKADAKHNRKMGHVTILSEHNEETLSRIDETGIWEG